MAEPTKVEPVLGVRGRIPGIQAVVSKLPVCDIHGSHDALYDANLGRGWGNVCQLSFDQYGCTVGVGHGQRLVTE